MSNKDGYVGMILPRIRRMTDYKKIAKDLVGIQPMTMPTGSIFYLDYTYGEHAIMATLRDSKDVRETLIDLIKKHKAETIRTVIVNSFPQYLELFEKLIILK